MSIHLTEEAIEILFCVDDERKLLDSQIKQKLMKEAEKEIYHPKHSTLNFETFHHLLRENAMKKERKD
jgi:hypothetical protein